jgi:HAD superfamily hydrolase (TIGR01459 family)
MTKMSETIPILPSMAALRGRYDAWLADIWGVIHNGVRAFEAACEACTRFREQGGVVVLISNAPRPHDAVARMLDRLGAPRAAYDAIVTSGDVTRRMLAAEPGRSVFHLGPDRDKGIFEGLDTRFVGADGADLAVNTGLFDDTKETPKDYAGMLQGFLARRVPMICANPDLMVERGDQLVYCAGALAVAYEEIGGTVHYAGKPHLPVYELAFELIATAAGRAVPRSRILAIGDGLKTDMAGAEAAGLDALFIPSLLHVKGDGANTAGEIDRLFAETGRAWRPIGAQLGLRW